MVVDISCPFCIRNREANCKFKNEPEFTYYEDKLREFVGKKNYKKSKPFLYVSSCYECKDKKRYPVAISTSIWYKYIDFELYLFEGEMFVFMRDGARRIEKGSIYYFTDDKFVRSDKKYKANSSFLENLLPNFENIRKC